MKKQTVTYPYNEEVLHYKKKPTTDTQKHYKPMFFYWVKVARNKQKKIHCIWFYWYKILEIANISSDQTGISEFVGVMDQREEQAAVGNTGCDGSAPGW